MTEQELVRQCLVEVYRRNGYEDASSLTQRDHEHISQEIESKTTILISVSTLKRLLNGEFSRIPQIATLNAISHYLGYKGWQEYKVSVKAKQTSFTVSEPAAVVEGRSEKPALFRISRFKRIALTLLGLVSVVAAVPFIQFSRRAPVRHADKAEFSAEKTTANEMPNTVIFHYNIDDVQADSFFIQQSWDVNRRVRIFKNNYTLTDIYYEPGYHLAKLIANDSVIKVVEVSIPTDRWFLFTRDFSRTSIPHYIKPDVPIIKDGVLKLDKNDLKGQVDLSVERNFIYAFFPSKLEVSSDNYIFKARIRVQEVRNNHCPSLMVEAWPQRYFMFFRTSLKGCASESMLQFGEQFLHGKTSDLSSLGYDVRNWVNVEMKVENRKVTILPDGKEAFTTTYKNSAGLLTGLAFISNGIPEIDFVEVKGLDGTVLYQNDFSQLQ